MTGPERALHERIAWLKATIALVRMTPLWPFWWPMLHLLESELALLDHAAQIPHAPVEPHMAPAVVIDLAQWRRRRDMLRGRGAAARA